MRPLAVLSLAAALACQDRLAAPVTEVRGTWGGENAGLVVSDSAAHVHIGCTLGDAQGPIRPDPDGRFDVAGTYNVDAFPVDRGIVHPARFVGRVSGRTMTLSVVLTDTTLQLGPVVLVHGREPRMGPCPICREPGPAAAQGPQRGASPIPARGVTLASSALRPSPLDAPVAVESVHR